MASPQQGPQAPVMIKPAQIDNLPFLDEGSKQQYKSGLANLWHTYESNAQGSTARLEAEHKIRTASTKLMTQLAQVNARRPGSGAGQPRPNTAGQGGMQPHQGNPQQMAQAQAAQAQAHAQAQAQAQARAQQQAGQASGQQGTMRLSERSQQEMADTKIVQPNGMSNAQYENLSIQWRRSAMEILTRREAIMNRARQLNAGLQAVRDKGQQPPEAAIRNFEEAKAALDTATKRWRGWKTMAETGQLGVNPQQVQQAAAAQAQQAQQQQQPPPPRPQGGNNAAAQHQQPQQQQPQQQPDVKQQVNTGAPRTSLSPPQPQAGFQHQASSNQQATPTQPNNMPQQQPNAQQQTPQTATQPQAPQNFPQQQNMQQPRPQINAQQAQNPNQMGQVPNQQTPGSAMPNSATQPNQQRPQPLNHQQAISQAAESYSRQQQAQQQQQAQPGQQPQPQLANGLPFNNQQPGSATQQNTPTQVYPNLQTTQTSSANTKFPIPKQLQLDARTQTAVGAPPSRPTLNNQGMMYNPGVARAPPYTLEGEGDRVLSKRKLDELVRQVTGGAPTSSSGESNNALSADVEENILQMADDFVDQVITDACKLAKLRPNQTLDIRDVQIVLERNYGIRIPGYSLDEVRTVRKFQPAPGWHSKMQAVQAGKVMGSRDS